jgi:hypothetical protein
MTTPRKGELVEAVKDADEARVRNLLDRGADPDEQDEDAGALHWAVCRGTFTIAEMLVEKGANLDAKDPAGVTALMYAGRFGKTDILRLLIDKGADFDIKDKEGFTAKEWVRQSCDKAVLDILNDAYDMRERRAEEKRIAEKAAAEAAAAAEKARAAHEAVTEKQALLKERAQRRSLTFKGANP